MDHDNPLMTTAELAATLKVSTDTVRRMCNAGKWPHTRIGRLYRFTEQHYQTIIEPTAALEPSSRGQRQNVVRLLQRLG